MTALILTVIGHVVFVCEHGNVKSVIAAEWFNRMAADRKLAVRAVSRGLTPEGAVPTPIAERLRADGFDVGEFRARAVGREDVRGASRLVMIGAPPPSWAATVKVPVETWEGIPPASERYDASRDALRKRITALLDELESAAPR